MTILRYLSVTIPLFVALLFSPPWVAASEASPDASADQTPADLISAEVIRSDLTALYNSLAAAHANLYAHRPKAQYDEDFDALMASVDGPMSRLDVIRLFMRFVAYGRVGHAKIDFPIPEYVAYLQQGGTLIPVDIRVEDGRVLIAHNYTTEPLLEAGHELVAINGRSADYWLKRTGRYVSAERPYMSHAQLENMFPRIFWLSEGQVDSFRFTVKTAEGEKTLVAGAVPVMTIEEHKGSLESVTHKREANMLQEGVAYLRPGPFYAMGDKDTLDTFTAFIDESFRTFIEAGADNLILDLRNNPGGDNSFSDPVIAWFADKPFAFASRFEVKASPQTRAVLKDLAGQYPDGLSAGMYALIQKFPDGDVFDFQIPDTPPRADGFKGRVWVLINRHSYSNATVTAAIIKDYGFGILVGEETSDLPTSYASSAQFTLPQTGIVVTYPKAYFVRPNGKESLSGVMPDIVIAEPLPGSEADAVLSVLLEKITTDTH